MHVTGIRLAGKCIMFDQGFFLSWQAVRRQLAAMPNDLYLVRLIHQTTGPWWPGGSEPDANPWAYARCRAPDQSRPPCRLGFESVPILWNRPSPAPLPNNWPGSMGQTWPAPIGAIWEGWLASPTRSPCGARPTATLPGCDSCTPSWAWPAGGLRWSKQPAAK